MNALTIDEQGRLDALELAIEGGLQSFIEVGAALAEIRQRRLYRATHGTFESYCLDRWDFTASRGRQLMAAVEALASLPDDAPKPANAAQASALADVEPEHRADAWDRARRDAEEEDRPVTARDIANAAKKVDPTPSDPPKVALTKGEQNMQDVAPAFKTALESLKAAVEAAEALSQTTAKGWLLLSGSALLKHLRDARDQIRAARPAGVCPVCKGKGCVKCQDTGWVSRARLDALS